jgi:hypothetical protein
MASSGITLPLYPPFGSSSECELAYPKSSEQNRTRADENKEAMSPSESAKQESTYRDGIRHRPWPRAPRFKGGTQLYVTLPVANTEGERSFSVLKRIKK